jgi:hypothetical protein
MRSRSSLPCSQEPSTGPYAGQDESQLSSGEDKNRRSYVSYLFSINMHLLPHVSTYDVGHHPAFVFIRKYVALLLCLRS